MMVDGFRVRPYGGYFYLYGVRNCAQVTKVVHHSFCTCLGLEHLRSIGMVVEDSALVGISLYQIVAGTTVFSSS
jgi:hypothetical protein